VVCGHRQRYPVPKEGAQATELSLWHHLKRPSRRLPRKALVEAVCRLCACGEKLDLTEFSAVESDPRDSTWRPEVSYDPVYKVPVRATRIPFHNFAGYYGKQSPLHLIMQACEATGDRSVFAGEVVSALLTFKWSSFGFYFFCEAGLYVIYIIVDTLYAWLYLLAVRDATPIFDPSPDTHPRSVALLMLWVLTSLFALWIFYLEVLQMQVVPLKAYAAEFWNQLHLAGVLMQLVLNILFCLRPFSSVALATTAHSLLGIQLTAVYIQLMSFFRGFAFLGPLVRMITRIFSESISFLMVLVVILLGFAMGLSLLLFGNGSDFDNLGYGILSTINYGLYSEFTGNDFFETLSACWIEVYTESGVVPSLINPEDDSCRVSVVAWSLFTVMMVLVQIVMLNLLIAIMTDSYEAVRENAKRESDYEKAKLILRVESSWLDLSARLRGTTLADEDAKFPEWLHVLQPLEQQADHADDANGKMAAIRLELAAVQAAVTAQSCTTERLESKTSALSEQLTSMSTVLQQSIHRLEQMMVHQTQGFDMGETLVDDETVQSRSRVDVSETRADTMASASSSILGPLPESAIAQPGLNQLRMMRMSSAVSSFGASSRQSSAQPLSNSEPSQTVSIEPSSSAPSFSLAPSVPPSSTMPGRGRVSIHDSLRSESRSDHDSPEKAVKPPTVFFSNRQSTLLKRRSQMQ